MAIRGPVRGHQQLTFEDLKGLRAEGYIRDSTLDQRDGFGPAIQRRAIEGFAQVYGLVLGSAWYTDFITGTSTLKRSGFREALQDAEQDRFDVLLVHHTSRFARNRADAIRYKSQLAALGKSIFFVSQGILSGRDQDFLSEGINEVLDEHYSRNLSRWVADGCWVKHQEGYANGVAPLGYRSEKLANGKRERKVPDWEGKGGNPKVGGMEVLLALLRGYQSGGYSYQSLAEYLNAQGYRNREGNPFSKGSVEHVLGNRFYQGQAVYHPNKPDETVREGGHEVPEEVRDLWLQCQEVKEERSRAKEGRPRLPHRSYPFARVAFCLDCHQPYTGQPVHRRNGRVVRRLYHKRPFCHLEPHSVRVEELMAQFQEGVLSYVALEPEWQEAVVGALSRETASISREEEGVRLEQALVNLRKQHLWGDITDQAYRDEREGLARQLRTLEPPPAFLPLPNLERAAELLADLPARWGHPGVTDQQREELVREVFSQVQLGGAKLVAIRPRPAYQPLFACILGQEIRKCRGGQDRTADLLVPNQAPCRWATPRKE